MAKHEELSSISVQCGRYRLCFDEVTRDDEDGRIEYAIVWRGTSVSPDGFVPRPAYFSLGQLGDILRKAIAKLTDEEIKEFLKALLKLPE
jgi:hypothetical protein